MSQKIDIPISDADSDNLTTPSQEAGEAFDGSVEHPAQQKQDSPEASPTTGDNTNDTKGCETTSPTPTEDAPETESLENRLETLQKENEQLHDLLLRKQAEFENFKKRLERNKNESIQYANESLICELLPVIDNFELAIAAAKEKEESPSHNEGVRLILKQLKDVLAKYDLTDIPAIGQPFDPAHHEAVMQVPSDEHPSNTVLDEHRKGYKLKSKTIRPAMVVVSKKEEKTSVEPTEASKD